MWGFVTSTAQLPSVVAGTQTATSGSIVMSQSNQVSFGMSNSSVVTASVYPALSFWQNQDQGVWAVGGASSTMLAIEPIGFGPFPGNMTISTAMFMIEGANSTSAAWSATYYFGIYTLNGSSLSLLNSASTLVSAAAATNNSTAYSGTRWLTIHSSQWSVQPVLTQTNYWLGVIQKTSQSSMMRLFFQQPVGMAMSWGTVGVSAGAVNQQLCVNLFAGMVTSATSALPTVIQTSDMTGNNGTVAGIPVVVFNNVFSAF